MGDRGDKSVLSTPAPSRRIDPVDASGPSAIGKGSSTTRAPGPTNRAAVSRRKRLLDLGLVLVLLPALLPLFLVIALLVALTSRGRVIFFQERIGLHGDGFRMMKFRTMRADAERRLRADPELWATYVENDFKLPAGADPRITTVGRLLRRSSLDELPQLVNVVIGQMSLVGPRPIVPEELAMYGADKDAYLSVKPGITGPWQVNGRSGIGYPERIALDREYATNWNFRSDLKILLQTPLAVLSRRGAH
jgi:exopolysaccharide production protein ExoY